MLRTTIQVPDTLFSNERNRILPPNGTRVSLDFLRTNLRGGEQRDQEMFFPSHIFVRQEMETAFRELAFRGTDTTSILSGSPGIGKSVLMFLVVVYQVVHTDMKAVYVRFVEDPQEPVSKFLIQRQADGSVEVRYTRKGDRSGNIASEYFALRGEFDNLEIDDPKIIGAVDGPKSDQFTRYTYLNYGCTSGCGIRIKHHMAAATFNVVMGAWTVESLRSVVALEYDLDQNETDQNSTKYFDNEAFDAVYFVKGGRIRGFFSAFASFRATGVVDTSFEDQVVARVSGGQAELSLSQSDCRSTSEHVDSLRSMFRKASGATDSVNLHVDSGYMIRGLKEKVRGEELFNSYKKAESEGNKGAQANYFEELMHWCLRQPGSFPAITSSVHADGSGRDGVAQLTSKNQYWIPSVPNFVNIDSAVVGSDSAVWCFQFSVSSSHMYKKRRLRPQFLNLLSVVDTTGEVTIVFVVPKGTNFTLPDTGSEVSMDIFLVDCSSLQSVVESVTLLASRIATPTSNVVY